MRKIKAGHDWLMDVVYILDHDFYKDHRLPYLQEMAKHVRLLCVEPPKLFPFSCLGKVEELRKVHDRLYLFRPLALVPHYIAWRFPALGCLSRLVLKASLRKAIDELGFKDFLLILAHPVEESLIGLIKEKWVCYESYDEWASHPGVSPGQGKLLREAERRLIEKTDIVFASSRHLAESKRRWNANTHFIPNAADAEFFGRALDAATPIPSDLASIPEPRIGLIGNINEIVDIDLINYLAEKQPNWSIVLIGEVNGGRRFYKSAAIKKALGFPNIHFLGRRDYSTLPSYLKGLNVCLLPYLVNEYTVNVYPSKVHQYLAGGKPVVSTDLPDMHSLSEVVAVARTQNDFWASVVNIFNTDDSVRILRRCEVARENTIIKRVVSKTELLNTLC